RVLQGEQVPTEEKIYSIFEPHTDLIKRGKAQKPVEFGHKVFLAESAQGLITDYQVLDGNPFDADHVPSSLDRHQQTFGNPPVLFRGRGMKRCPFKGRQRFEILVGAAVLTNNLMRIADLLNNNRRIARPRAA